MKARIPNLQTPTILIFGLADSPKKQILSRLCQEKGILLKEVTTHDLAHPLGYLAGFAGYSPAENAWEKEVKNWEAMVFCGMGEPEIYSFLQTMGEQDIKIPLKALVTPHNQSWAFGALLGELEEEYLALEAGREQAQ